MEWLLIHPKKQDNRKSGGGGGWRWEGERGGTWTKFEKGARQYRVGLGKIKGLGPLCQR